MKYFELMFKISPANSNIGYINHWTSGYGIKEVIEYIDNEAKNVRVAVAVRRDAGNPESAVFAYFHENKRVEPIYLDAGMFSADLRDIDCLETSAPLYFVSRDGNMGGLNKYFEEIDKYYKPQGDNFVGVHKLKQDCEGESIKLF